MSRRHPMSVFTIVARSMRHHAVATAITAAAAALGCGLVVSVFAIEAQARRAFELGDSGFDAVLGARGSKLQLVLNAVFHLETSPGNIPWTLFEEVRRDPDVEVAVPYAVGDSYHGFRVVGTTPDVFTKLEFQRGRKLETEPGGDFFDPTRREAVVGSFVAEREKLGVNATFHPSHGVTAEESSEHEETYTVVGVLKPTNSPVDRVVFIPLEGLYRLSGHVLNGAGRRLVPKPEDEIPDADREVSSVLLKLRSSGAGLRFESAHDLQAKGATLAYPIAPVMADIFEKLGWMTGVLRLVALLVAVVAAASIAASMYNTVKERRREFAILRSLGAHKSAVVRIVVFESAATAAIGGLAGVLVHLGVFAVAAAAIRAETGVVLDVFQFHPAIVLAPVGMVLLGAAAGLVPALEAYRTDVANNLYPTV